MKGTLAVSDVDNSLKLEMLGRPGCCDLLGSNGSNILGSSHMISHVSCYYTASIWHCYATIRKYLGAANVLKVVDTAR